MMKQHKLVLLVLALGVLVSCSDRDFIGNGPIVSESRSVDNFESIRSEISADIYLTQDPEQSLRIETNENLMSVVETRVVNGELRIESNRNIRSTKRTQIFISAADFKSIMLTGSGSLESMNCMDLADLELHITGSTNVDFCGTTDNLGTTITGSGNINAFGLDAKTVNSTITGSGDVKVSVTDELEVRISGSGSVLYKGDPAVSTRITGSGSVKKSN